jgi:hypothetical protein
VLQVPDLRIISVIKGRRRAKLFSVVQRLVSPQNTAPGCDTGGCILWRYQALQVPDLRIIKGRRRAKLFSAVRPFVVASRGRGGGSSSSSCVIGRTSPHTACAPGLGALSFLQNAIFLGMAGER